MEWKPDLTDCHLCPRSCGADRTAGERGVCGMPAVPYGARASLHMWEEPCISGEEGSGTVFFSGCPLGCVYCQNREISGLCSAGSGASASGKEGLPGIPMTAAELARCFLRLQNRGANNINLVTPTHYAVSVKEAVELARREGLALPIVYNTSGYELPEAIRWLSGTVDIYLTDLKYMDGERARRYSRAADYPKWAKLALREMVKQTGPCVFDERGMLKRGVIVRHLLLPGGLADSKKIVRYLWETYGNQIYISLMSQYTPQPSLEAYPELMRRVRRKDYEKLVDYALSLGVEQGFIQEEGAASESFIPSFHGEGIREEIP